MNLISKKYDPSFESELYAQWKSAGWFTDTKTEGETFVIPLPPPNVTGNLHLGHAIMLAIEDAMVRYARMHGKRVLRIPGTDHASISTQVVVERDLWRDVKKTKYDLGRNGFLDKVWDWVRESRSTITGQMEKMGASVDWSREEFTMSEQLSRAVRKAFVQLYQERKIYRDTYMVNRSPKAETVLSDLEVDYKTEKVKLYYIRYFIQGKGESLTVATVRPETMFGDVAVAVHPKDRRYKKRIGKNVLIPIVNRPIPIIADEHVSMEFGTGVLKITPSHAEEDFFIAKKHGLPLEHYSLDFKNHYTENAGPDLVGKDAYEFMDNLVHLLGEIGNLEQIVDYETSVPYCERTGCRVQPMLSQQRFFDVRESASQVKDYLNTGQIRFHPEKFEKQFHHWLDAIRPWCISRQLWRGHRIPVWYDAQGTMMVYDEDTVINAEKNNYTILSQIIFNLIADCRLPNPFSLEDLIDLLFKPSLTPQRGLLYHVYASIYREKYKHEKEKLKEIDHLCSILDTTDKDHKNLVKQGDALIDLLENSVQIVAEQGDAYRFIFPGEEGGRLVQDEDVLDTRFSSGLRPFSILGWPEQTADLSTYYPSSVLETGYDIIFFRVIRMMLMGVSLTGKMPFEQVYLHGLVRAEDGQKMSKSKGNGVDPLELIEKYGADALRGALLLGNTPGNDQRFSMQKVDYLWRFINKLRNATRYVQGTIGQLLHEKRSYTEMYHYLTDHIDEFSEYDNWIISKLNTVISSTTKYYEKFMIGEALQEIITFLWHDFCDWYIEIVKGNHSDLTPTILMYVLGTSYKILHPACPFVTEYLRQHTGFDEQLIASTWPLAIEGGKKNYRFNLLMDMITQWRALKQEVTKNSSEEVTLLVQGNKDIQLLVEEHEVLVKKLLYVSSIQYCNEQDPTPEGFQTVLLLDIKLGVQGLAKKDRKSQLHELEKKVEEEEQFLQRMRVTIASTDFLDKAPPKVVEEKKQKMDEVRQRIGALQHEIQRIKMEHK